MMFDLHTQGSVLLQRRRDFVTWVLRICAPTTPNVIILTAVFAVLMAVVEDVQRLTVFQIDQRVRFLIAFILEIQYFIKFKTAVRKIESLPVFNQLRVLVITITLPFVSHLNLLHPDYIQIANSLSVSLDLVRVVHTRASVKRKRLQTRETRTARAWSILCLPRFARWTTKKGRLLVVQIISVAACNYPSKIKNCTHDVLNLILQRQDQVNVLRFLRLSFVSLMLMNACLMPIVILGGSAAVTPASRDVWILSLKISKGVQRLVKVSGTVLLSLFLFLILQY